VLTDVGWTGMAFMGSSGVGGVGLIARSLRRPSGSTLCSVLETWISGRTAVKLSHVANTAKTDAYNHLPPGGMVIERDLTGGQRIIVIPPQSPVGRSDTPHG